MLRRLFIGLLVSYVLAATDDVEITDEEPLHAGATDVQLEELDENDFKGAEQMNALLAFVDPSLGLRESAGPISLVAGKSATVVISLENTDISATPSHFSLYSLQASLHYPRYYSYYIQNFTIQQLQNNLEPSQQASLHYSFMPATQLAGQNFDLSIVLAYGDQLGKLFLHALFNETIALLEDDEGMDTEMLFLGVLVFALGLLAIFAIWQWFSSKTSKRSLIKDSSTNNVRTPQENEYIALTKKSVVPTKLERANGGVKRRQGKK